MIIDIKADFDESIDCLYKVFFIWKIFDNQNFQPPTGPYIIALTLPTELRNASQFKLLANFWRKYFTKADTVIWKSTLEL